MTIWPYGHTAIWPCVLVGPRGPWALPCGGTSFGEKTLWGRKMSKVVKSMSKLSSCGTLTTHRFSHPFNTLRVLPLGALDIGRGLLGIFVVVSSLSCRRPPSLSAEAAALRPQRLGFNDEAHKFRDFPQLSIRDLA